MNEGLCMWIYAEFYAELFAMHGGYRKEHDRGGLALRNLQLSK